MTTVGTSHDLMSVPGTFGGKGGRLCPRIAVFLFWFLTCVGGFEIVASGPLAIFCCPATLLMLPSPQEDRRWPRAKRIEADAQTSLEDRFIPTSEIVVFVANGSVVFGRHAHASLGLFIMSLEMEPSDLRALRSRRPSNTIITPKKAA